MAHLIFLSFKSHILPRFGAQPKDVPVNILKFHLVSPRKVFWLLKYFNSLRAVGFKQGIIFEAYPHPNGFNNLDPLGKHDGLQHLPIKGTAWVAGFPVTNAVLEIDDTEDYVGPSIDAGFRLCALSTPSRLAVSVELGWLLGIFESPLQCHFEGRCLLKGLSENTGYPQIWVEVQPSRYQGAEDKLLGKKVGISAGDLAELCEHYILEHGVPSYLPFLVGEPKATVKPSWYDEELALITESVTKQEFAEPEPSAIQKGQHDWAEFLRELQALKFATPPGGETNIPLNPGDQV